jgi:hypothetical protein
MKTQLIRAKVLRPFAWLGRYAATGERLNLPADVFEDLAKTGHVARIEDAAPAVLVLRPDRWAHPVER